MKLNPTNPEFSLELGRLHLEAENYQEAILAFQKAGHNPNFEKKARGELAKCFFQQVLHVLATKEHEEVLADQTSNEVERLEATYALADCYSEMGETERAFELFGEVYRKHADFKNVRDRVFELNEKL